MFKPGQKVKFVRTVRGAKPAIPLGSCGVITAAYLSRGTIPGWRIDYAGFGEMFSESAEIEPIVDRGDYERFMDRVMKPIDLGSPVTA